MRVDKSILIEYADMKEEIKDLRRRISEDEKELDKLENMVVTDSVTCGKKGKKPLRTVKIKGRPTMAISRKNSLLRRRIARLGALEVELLELTNQVEEYITEVRKSELRLMFRMYYLDNLNWVQVAHRMNTMFPKKKRKYTEDSCRCKHNRYLEKNEKTTVTTDLKC